MTPRRLRIATRIVGLAAFTTAAPLLSQNLVVNGSFESPNVGANSFALLEQIPGWSRSFGSRIEIQNRLLGPAHDGNQHLEMDSNANYGIQQTLPTTPGAAYRLSFAYSPRPRLAEVSNRIEVFLNGERIAAPSATGTGLTTTSWTVTERTVTATSEAATLEFRGAGLEDHLGGFLDDVRFERLAITGLTLSASCSDPGCTSVRICWPTEVGWSYRLQVSPDPASGIWLDLGNPTPGTGSESCASEPVPQSPGHQFYRVVRE